MKGGSQRVVLEATISDLAPGGDGVAIATVAAERRAVFVRGVALGDRLKLEVDLEGRPARGRVLERLSDGPSRVPPGCAHVARCGGCDWMHVALSGQLVAHESHVRRALPREFREVKVTVHPAPEPLAYRVRARVHVRASGGRAIVGAYAAASHDPVEVDRCAVLHPDLERARKLLAPLFEGTHGRGDVQLALGDLDAPVRRAVLDIHWQAVPPAFLFTRLEEAVTAGALRGARVFYAEGTRPAVIGDPTPWMRGADGAPLRLAPGGFGQPSEAGNQALATRVAALAPPGLRTLELYAGAGNFSVLLARSASELVVVETSREACSAARENLAARNLTARVVEGDAARFPLGSTTQLLVLDPPRTGAREVAGRLHEHRPLKAVVYVSCDPQTLGRDLALLTPRFALRAVEIFPMFPQTSHVEVVALLERARG